MNKIISVYFSGTGFSINDDFFLAASLLAQTEESEAQIKMGFNGCYVDYGVSGLIFGSGLDAQCDKVINRILEEIDAGHHITLNAYGHSRGGVAALLLAKQLSHIDEEKLTINLVLLDPVPGNLITTSNIDPFEISLANKVMDLSDCKPLRKVLALYPHIPLLAILCHAPLLVTYPKETEVEEEVVNGCHAQAEYVCHPSSRLVRLRVEEFLVNNGTQLDVDRDYRDAEKMKQIYLELYQEELEMVRKVSSRGAHSARGLVITATPEAKYFNTRHKNLVGDNSEASVSLRIEPNTGLFSCIGSFLTQYPLVDQALKWVLFHLSLVSLLYVSGGLAAVPLLVPALSMFGAPSLLVLSSVMTCMLAALWYTAVKPILSWCADQFFYPHYVMRKPEAPKTEADQARFLSFLHTTTKDATEDLEYNTEEKSTLSFN